MEDAIVSQAMKILASRRLRATITCRVCGRQVGGVMARRFYCSGACKQRAIRERDKDRRRAAPRPPAAPPGDAR